MKNCQELLKISPKCHESSKKFQRFKNLCLKEYEKKFFMCLKTIPSNLYYNYFNNSKVPLWEHNYLFLVNLAYQLQSRSKSMDKRKESKKKSLDLLLYEAEGETSANFFAKPLYSRSEYISIILNCWNFKFQKYFFIKTYLYKILFFLRKHLRTYGVLTVKFIFQIKNLIAFYLSQQEIKNFKPLNNKKINKIFLSRSIAHAEFFFQHKRKNNFFLSFESERTYPSHLKSTRNCFTQNVSDGYAFLTLGDILNSFFFNLKKLLQFDLFCKQEFAEYFPLLKLNISFRQIIRESIVQNFDAHLLKIIIFKINQKFKKIHSLYHGELFTHFSPALKKICDDNKINCFQMSFGTYKLQAVPPFLFCKRFFCFSKIQLHEWYDKLQDKKLVFRGNPFLLKKYKTSIHNPYMLYFCTPYDMENELTIIKKLNEIANQIRKKLVVILHPRDDKIKKIKLVKFKPISNTQFQVKKTYFYSKCFCAINRCSNISYQQIIQNIPVVNILWNQTDRKVTHEYYRFKSIISKNKRDLHKILANQKKLLKTFKIFRVKYMTHAFNR